MSSEAGTLLHTPLYDEHLRLGARMVPFAGWEMPVQYAGVIEEHNAVRGQAGMFDVSHMGRFEVLGGDAGRFLRYICTWDMTRLAPGEGHYAAACNEAGGILDDVYVFCLAPERYLIVVNASNAPKMWAWMSRHVSSFDARLVNRHEATAMIAVQGPEAIERMGGDFVRSIKPRHCAETDWRGHRLFASRTGYTGEDGLELVIGAEAGADLWRELLDAGVAPCGLGARDTLRLEAALLLYGNDMDEATNPFEVGLEWVLSLEDTSAGSGQAADFLGRVALERIATEGVKRTLVCLRALDRGVMRHEHPIRYNGETVGLVTSGTFSPTLAVSIGMGFVPPELSAEGTRLEIDVRGRMLPAEIVPRPFYKRPRKA
ncbi:MAG TPA: glycine cleavage system aminomethyltransferase GcvT [Dehalococcoidia bacterium]|nr:glycine cleavage system aminomethyltransferase GcvT [Dehalococcoidia bacterium]